MKITSLTATILFLSAKLFSQCYTVAQTTYVSDTTSWTTQTIVQVGDDQWSQVIPIGFTFCYYGAQYDSLLIGTNGAISFNTSQSAQYCPWPIPAANAPTNSYGWTGIMGPWQDLQMYQQSPTRIFCWTSGLAPNRTFTVKYDSVPMYSCVTSCYSGRIILHETTNIIEVHLDVKSACSWNGGRAILGIQNQNGTQAVVAPGHNALNSGWTASQEAWLFTPICNVCSGVGIIESNSDQTPFAMYPNPSTGATRIVVPADFPTVRTLEITDVTGRVVETKSVELSAGDQQEIFVDAPGIYVISLYDENGILISARKLIRLQD